MHEHLFPDPRILFDIPLLELRTVLFVLQGSLRRQVTPQMSFPCRSQLLWFASRTHIPTDKSDNDIVRLKLSMLTHLLVPQDIPAWDLPAFVPDRLSNKWRRRADCVSPLER
ncbi:unnamed protein product [Durusdinium trenchii]|uniref:Uncharacterized protein n=1 Tax=Durusdinium trenchii TaxID=1381693 RepID=A0ABP0KVI5_9DINO